MHQHPWKNQFTFWSRNFTCQLVAGDNLLTCRAWRDREKQHCSFLALLQEKIALLFHLNHQVLSTGVRGHSDPWLVLGTALPSPTAQHVWQKQSSIYVYLQPFLKHYNYSKWCANKFFVLLLDHMWPEKYFLWKWI